MSVIDIVTLGQAGLFEGGLKTGGKNLLKTIGVEFLSNGAALTVNKAGEMLNLPAPIVLLLSLGAGYTVSRIGTKNIVKNAEGKVVYEADDAIKGVGKANKYSLSGEEHYESLKDLFGADNVKWETKGKKYDNAIFADDEKLVSHYWKHRKEFGAYSLDDYLNQAREVMNNGYEVNYPYKG